MNREIKFRALKDDMSNCNWVYGNLVFSEDGVPRITNDGGKTFHTCIEGTESEYTGLKDKNRKEIYEGDIMIDRFGDLFIVEIKPGIMQMRKMGHRRKGQIKSRCYNIGGEVIGNIYEHPHLLNNEQEDERSVATKMPNEQNAENKEQ